MGAWMGWGLAVACVAIGYAVWGWAGVALAVSAVVFWLLLQFSQAMRAMRDAGRAPVGHVASAVMLHARLQKGLRLMDLIRRTRSLGLKVADEPETFVWQDASGARVTVQLVGGRVSAWTLERTGAEPSGEPVAPADAGAAAASP